MTREDRDKAKYKSVWLLMDKIDQEHSINKRQWQQRELEAIVMKLKKFHFNAIIQPPHVEFHKKIDKAIEEVESDADFDFLSVDRLKDAIHSIWKDYEKRDGEIKVTEESPLVDRMEQFDNAKDINFFNNFKFRNLYYGHSKRGKDQEFEEMEHFFMKFFGKYDEKNGTDFVDSFGFYLHDFYQELRSIRFHSEHFLKIIEAHEKDLITEKCFMYLMKLYQKMIDKSLDQGEWTEDLDDLESEARITWHLLHDILDGGKNFEWTVRCDSGQNCDQKIKMTRKEIQNFELGKPLNKKYCVFHQSYNENGDRVGVKELDYETLQLPKVPVVLRWHGIMDHEWNQERKILEHLEKFIDANTGHIEIVAINEENHFTSDCKPDKTTSYYVVINDKKVLLKFCKAFDDDFNYGLQCEIMPERKDCEECGQVQFLIIQDDFHNTNEKWVHLVGEHEVNCIKVKKRKWQDIGQELKNK